MRSTFFISSFSTLKLQKHRGDFTKAVNDIRDNVTKHSAAVKEELQTLRQSAQAPPGLAQQTRRNILEFKSMQNKDLDR